MYQIPEQPKFSKGEVIVRWIFVPLSPFVGWAISFALTLFVTLFILEPLANFTMRFCPPEKIDDYSGTCTTSWYYALSEIPFVLGASLVAISSVVLPASIAPYGRFRVALIAFLIGVIVAFRIGGVTLSGPFAAAFFSGLLALLWIARQTKTKTLVP